MTPPLDTLVEGLYAFDPSALSPTCATVTFQLFSEKDQKPDTLIVDPKIIEQIWKELGGSSQRPLDART